MVDIARVPADLARHVHLAVNFLLTPYSVSYILVDCSPLMHRRIQQYRRMLRKWGFEKNVGQQEWDQALAIVRKRKAEGKDTQLTIDGKVISAKRLDKRSRRPDVRNSVQAFSAASDLPSEANAIIVASTPPSINAIATNTRQVLGTPTQLVLAKLPFIQSWNSIVSTCKACLSV